MGQHEEGMMNKREGSMMQGETQQLMQESNQFDTYKFSLDAPIGIHENTVRSEPEKLTLAPQMEKPFGKLEREQAESPVKLPSLMPSSQDKMIKT